MAHLEAVADLSQATDAELDALERRLAAPFMRVFPWGIILWGFANAAVWLALWPLVLLDLMPLAVAFPIAVLNVALFLPAFS